MCRREPENAYELSNSGQSSTTGSSTTLAKCSLPLENNLKIVAASEVLAQLNAALSR